MPDNNPLPLEIDCHSVQQKLAAGAADFVLLDCREPDEYALVHIDQAVLLPMSQLQARLSELQPHREKQIAVHCHHGGRSLKVTQWLRSQGYQRVQSMAGGIDQWAQQINPTLTRY